MLKLVFVFLIIALVAGVFAFTDIAAAAPRIAEILFYSFLALFFWPLPAGCWPAAECKATGSDPLPN